MFIYVFVSVENRPEGSHLDEMRIDFGKNG